MNIRLTLLIPILFGAIAEVLPGQQKTADTGGTVANDEASTTPPGSTLTSEQLKAVTSSEEQPVPIIEVQAAAEPVPAMRYRLYPARYELRPDSAMLHYARALIMFQAIPPDERAAWNQLPVLTSSPEAPDAAQIETAIEKLSGVFAELHGLAMSEDLRWDHRLRDLKGPEVYQYLLPDVQEARTMGRLLRIRIHDQLRKKDFEGVVSSIRDGFRLAEFVGQGETAIQKLVGIAIHAMMRDALEQTIRTPGCPNLYWAIACVPPRLVDVGESIDWEVHNITQILPELRTAEKEIWSQEVAAERWTQLLRNLRSVADDASQEGSRVEVMLTVASVAMVAQAREHLKAAGYDDQRLAAIPDLQVTLIEAARQIQQWGDHLAKGHKLPRFAGSQILDREETRLRQWADTNREKSVGAAIMNVLYPSVRQLKEAETRMILSHSRLMTLEAIRMYAAGNSGALPASLNDLTEVPALPDPYTNQPFQYHVETIDGKSVVTLTAGGPRTFRALRELRFTIVK